MKRWFFIFLLIPLTVLAQEQKIGKNFIWGTPIGSKVIDIGFRNKDYVNISTVKRGRFLLLRWDKSKLSNKIDYFEVWLSIPKSKIIEKDFGLVKINENLKDVNFSKHRKLPESKRYVVVEVSYFEYLFKILCFDKNSQLIDYSQVRYVKQKS